MNRIVSSNSTPKPGLTRLAIVGVVRNGAATLQPSVEALRSAFSIFGKLRFHVVESDSDDNTRELLAELAQAPDFSWESAGRLRSTLGARTERIAHCRNLAAGWVARECADFPYVCVADLDGVNLALSTSSIQSCWRIAEPWDVLCANQDGRYYDIWALRHPHWSPGDCWREFAALRTIFGEKTARKMAIFSRQVELPHDSPPVEVESAFGGLALYRREAFLAGTYRGRSEDGIEVCEHVSFHRDLREAGFRILINPRLLNGSQIEHTSRRPLPLRLWRNIKAAVRSQ